MKNTEYEYSFKVKTLHPFVEYCKKNNYEMVEESRQLRKLFKKSDKTMARITIKEKNGIVKKLFDFKDDNMSDEVLIERRETLSIPFDEEESVLSIIDFLGYTENNKLDRNRFVYKKENVIFELDSYISPEIMFVVAIKGEKEKTDLVYNEIKQNFSEYII